MRTREEIRADNAAKAKAKAKKAAQSGLGRLIRRTNYIPIVVTQPGKVSR